LIVTLRGHKKRIDVIKFHPSAGNVLASASFDKSIKLWDASVETEKLSYDFPDSVFSIDWNYNGSLLAVMGKDKKIRIFDPRASSIAQVRLPPPAPKRGLTPKILLFQEGASHEGVKPSYVVWLGDADRLASTGFTKMRERELAIWDVRDLSKPAKREGLDSSTGVIIPLFDNDAKILYLAGKVTHNTTTTTQHSTTKTQHTPPKHTTSSPRIHNIG